MTFLKIDFACVTQELSVLTENDFRWRQDLLLVDGSVHWRTSVNTEHISLVFTC